MDNFHTFPHSFEIKKINIGLKKIKYTPDAADKLRDMKSTITTQYGSKRDSWGNNEVDSWS